MKKRLGFTLIEVLVVAVIAISITAFSVPLYKKSQERNKFSAAQGVLMDIASSLQALRTDYIGVGVDEKNVPENPVKLMGKHNYQYAPGYKAAKEATELKDVSSTHTPYILFAREYMQPIFADTNESTVNYKGYRFYLCSTDKSKNKVGCCASGSTTLSNIACMQKITDCLSSDFPGAYVAEGGTVVPVDKTSAAATTQAICNIK